MVQSPIELSILSEEKNFLFQKLDGLIADKAIMADIAQLVGYDFSLKVTFQRALGLGVVYISPSSVDTIRKKLAMEIPAAIEVFDKLISVSKEYNRKNSPFVVY